jgi:hypothetical protein
LMLCCTFLVCCVVVFRLRTLSRKKFRERLKRLITRRLIF